MGENEYDISTPIHAEQDTDAPQVPNVYWSGPPQEGPDRHKNIAEQWLEPQKSQMAEDAGCPDKEDEVRVEPLESANGDWGKDCGCKVILPQCLVFCKV